MTERETDERAGAVTRGDVEPDDVTAGQVSEEPSQAAPDEAPEAPAAASDATAEPAAETAVRGIPRVAAAEVEAPAPADEPVAEDDVTDEAPAAEEPAEAPAAGAAAEDDATDEALADGVPAAGELAEVPADETDEVAPADEAPAAEEPNETPTDEAPATEEPADEPDEVAPADEVSADEAPTDAAATAVLDQVPAAGEPTVVETPADEVLTDDGPSHDEASAAEEPAVVLPADAPTVVATADEAPTVVATADETPTVATPPVDEEADASPIPGLEGEPPSRRGRKIALGVGIGVVVLAAAYAGAAWWVADRVPRGASVAGVEIGGLESEDAVARLESDLAERVVEPVDVRAGDAQTTLDPAAAGLALDAPATVDALSGFSWDPRDVWRHVVGTGEEPAISTVDEEALAAAIEAVDADVAVAPTEGSIAFANAEPVVTEPADGVQLDAEATTELLTTSWLTAERPMALPTAAAPPTIGEDAIAEAMATIAEPLVSAPVSVVAGDATVPLSVEQLTSVASLVPEGSRLELQIDEDALAQLVSTAAPDVGTAPEDARVELQNGAPVVVPSVNGTGIDPAALASAVATAATSTGERTATVELSETEAEFTTADAEALGITERISEFSTPLPPYPDPPRTANIELGASRVSGILLMPGDTFSLLDTLSPFNAANGYHQSGVVENGFEAKAYGGGLSQLSTTLFNAAFEAGLEDITHKPHSRWFSRYPEGREATLFEGSVDMQFRNTTDHGILLQAWVEGGRTHAAIWGTPTFDVDITTGQRYAFTSPRTVYNTSPECIAEPGGSDGFSVQVRRVVSRDGETVRDDTYTWAYQPWNTVVCGPDPATQPQPPPDDGGGGEG